MSILHDIIGGIISALPEEQRARVRELVAIVAIGIGLVALVVGLIVAMVH
jgi:hypothetical protein